MGGPGGLWPCSVRRGCLRSFGVRECGSREGPWTPPCSEMPGLWRWSQDHRWVTVWGIRQAQEGTLDRKHIRVLEGCAKPTRMRERVWHQKQQQERQHALRGGSLSPPTSLWTRGLLWERRPRGQIAQPMSFDRPLHSVDKCVLGPLCRQKGAQQSPVLMELPSQGQAALSGSSKFKLQ